jgi:hypothetical protein
MLQANSISFGVKKYTHKSGFLTGIGFGHDDLTPGFLYIFQNVVKVFSFHLNKPLLHRQKVYEIHLAPMHRS